MRRLLLSLLIASAAVPAGAAYGLPAGSTVAGFGNQGSVTLTVAGADLYPAGLVAQGNRLLVLAVEEGAAQSRVFRLNQNGSPDLSFGGIDGVTEAGVAVGGIGANAQQLVLSPDGSKIYVAGRTAGGHAAVAQLDAYTGAPVTGFGTSGVATVDDGGATGSNATGVAVSGNRVIVAGERSNGSSEDLLFAAFDQSGTPVGTFGTGGRFFTDPSPGAGEFDRVTNLLAQPSGAVVAAIQQFGLSDALIEDSAVIRVTSGGTLDSGFAGGTGAFHFTGGLQHNTITALDSAGGGRIAVGGYAVPVLGTSAISTVLTADGLPAAGFDGSPRTVSAAGTVISDVAFLEDGSLAFAGGRDTGVGTVSVSGRLGSLGALDGTWGVAAPTPGITQLSPVDDTSATEILKFAVSSNAQSVVTARGISLFTPPGDAPITITAQSYNGPPTFNLVASPPTAALGEPRTLTAADLVDADDADDAALTFDVDNDGNPEVSGRKCDNCRSYTFSTSGAPGERVAKVTAVDRFGLSATRTANYRVDSATTIPKPLGPPADTVRVPPTTVQAVVRGFELTQGSQDTIQAIDQGQYQGVPLIKGKKLMARVFVGYQTATELKVNPTVQVRITGADSSTGKPLTYSPVLADYVPNPRLNSYTTVAVTDWEQAGRDRAYVFELPRSWTERTGRIDLRATARVIATSLPGNYKECTTTACLVRAERQITGIGFRALPEMTISALKLTYRDPNTSAGVLKEPGPAADAYDKIGALPFPTFRWKTNTGASTSYPAYETTIDVTPQAHYVDPKVADANSEVTLDRVLRWRAEQVIQRKALGIPTSAPDPVGYLVQGVHFGGLIRGLGSIGAPGSVAGSSPKFRRWLTEIDHEVGHNLGLQHADKEGVSGCGGNGPGTYFDDNGKLGSVGLDLSEMPPVPRSGANTFDMMSYCGNITSNGGDPGHWLSAYNWRLIVSSFKSIGGSASGASAATVRARSAITVLSGGPSLRVSATQTEDGAVGALAIAPMALPVREGDADSDVVAVAYGEAGNELARRTMTTTPNGEGGAQLAATVPAANVAKVELLRGGGSVGRLARSANAPKVQVAQLPRRVGGALKIGVSATDSDKDPLEATIRYSPDGGKSWAELYSGPPRKVTIPAGQLASSLRGQISVVVNDGFRETTVKTRKFVVLPRPPMVSIGEPSSGARGLGGAYRTLAGSAFDDKGRTITGKNLRWYAGKRLLGTGKRITAALPAGTRSVRLVARDRGGASAAATVKVRITASTPLFRAVVAPKSLSRSARRVTLRVTADQDSTLTIGKRRYSVGTKAKRVTVAVKPGRGKLVLKLSLRAGGKATSATVTVKRR